MGRMSEPRTDSRINTYLDSATREDLVALIRTLVAASSETAAAVEAEAAAASGDTSVLEQLLKDAISTAVTGWSAGRSRARYIVRALETPVSLLEANLDAQPGIVAASSRKLLERLRTLFLRIDDSGGRLQEVTARIVDLNVLASQKAIARRELDEAVLARWIVTFNKADSAGAPEIYLDTYQGVLADKGLRVAKKALDTWEKKWEKERDEDTSPYARYRSTPWSLEYLQEQHAMLTGDVDAHVHALLNATSAKTVAAMLVLEDAGRIREARDLLERIIGEGKLTSRGTNDFWLSTPDAVDRLIEDGREEEVLPLVRDQFLKDPGETTYRGLVSAQERVSALGVDAVPAGQWAREQMSRNPAMLVLLELLDGRPEEAWRIAESYEVLDPEVGRSPGRGDLGMMRRYLLTTEEQFPVRVAELYVIFADDRVARAQTASYPHGVELLMHALALFLDNGEDVRAQDRLDWFCSRHKPKWRLMEQLEESLADAGW